MGRPNESAVLSEELAEFLRSGVSISIATRDANLTPNGTRVWAVTVDDDRVHVTAYVYAKTAEPILRDLRAHPAVALGFDRPHDSRACQIKGFYVDARPGRPAERKEIERQVAGFFGNLEMIGIPQAAFVAWKRWPAVAIKIRVTDVFLQTPGPGAGERVR
jgi:hypothetical protein